MSPKDWGGTEMDDGVCQAGDSALGMGHSSALRAPGTHE